MCGAGLGINCRLYACLQDTSVVQRPEILACAAVNKLTASANLLVTETRRACGRIHRSAALGKAISSGSAKCMPGSARRRTAIGMKEPRCPVLSQDQHRVRAAQAASLASPDQMPRATAPLRRARHVRRYQMRWRAASAAPDAADAPRSPRRAPCIPVSAAPPPARPSRRGRRVTNAARRRVKLPRRVICRAAAVTFGVAGA